MDRSFAALLKLTPKDLAGLRWIKGRCDQWIFAEKRRRKYTPPSDFSADELFAYRTVLSLKNAACCLLGATGYVTMMR